VRARVRVLDGDVLLVPVEHARTRQRAMTFGGVGTKNPVGLVATVFPEFIARGPRSARRGAVKEEAPGVARPAAEGEDTAWRALTAPRRALRSRTR